MKTLFSVVTFALLVLNAPAVEACSCGGYPTICGSYRGANAVFIGVVQRVETRMAKASDGREFSASQIAHVQVEKSFKGVAQPELVFYSGGSSCDAVYEEGQRWLFYAYYNKDTKTWSTAACDRSRVIKEVSSIGDDLIYLQNLPKSAAATRLSGDLAHYEADPVKGFTRIRNIMGAKVKITGEGKIHEVYTDKDGVYEIYGLPPGKYTVEPEIPLGLKVRFPMHYGELDYSDPKNVKLVLHENSCASMGFVLSSKNRIAGKVFGADGQVLPNVCLNLSPKDKVVASNWNFDCTDAQGRYELDGIPPGEYLIVLNSKGKISSNEPFPTAYFPGVFEKNKATVLAITGGSNLEDYDIHIPSQEKRRTLEGVLQYSDGKPAVNEFVEFNADQVKEGFEGRAQSGTDDQGRFTLIVLEGLKGTLRGFMHTYEGEFENCPQLDKLIRAQGNKSDVGTKPMPVEITRDMQNIKLTFPFPSCKRPKKEN